MKWAVSPLENKWILNTIMWHSSHIIQRAINNTWFCLQNPLNLDYVTTRVSVLSPLVHLVKYISAMCQLSQITYVYTQIRKKSSSYSYSTENCCSIQISRCSLIHPASDRAILASQTHTCKAVHDWLTHKHVIPLHFTYGQLELATCWLQIWLLRSPQRSQVFFLDFAIIHILKMAYYFYDNQDIFLNVLSYYIIRSFFLIIYLVSFRQSINCSIWHKYHWIFL